MFNDFQRSLATFLLLFITIILVVPPTFALTATTLSFDAPPSTVIDGTTIYFTGRLMLADGSGWLVGATIGIYDSDGSCFLLCSSDLLASGITDADGYFSIPWTVYCEDNEDPCTLEIFAEFESVGDFLSSTAPAGYYYVEVTPVIATATILSLDVPPASVQEGDVVTFTGRLVRNDTGAGVAGATIYIHDFDGGPEYIK